MPHLLPVNSLSSQPKRSHLYYDIARIEFFETRDSTSTIVTRNQICSHASAGRIYGYMGNEEWGMTDWIETLLLELLLASRVLQTPDSRAMICMSMYDRLHFSSQVSWAYHTISFHYALYFQTLYYLQSLLAWYWNAQEYYYSRWKATTRVHFYISLQMKSYPMCSTPRSTRFFK